MNLSVIKLFALLDERGNMFSFSNYENEDLEGGVLVVEHGCILSVIISAYVYY